MSKCLWFGRKLQCKPIYKGTQLPSLKFFSARLMVMSSYFSVHKVCKFKCKIAWATKAPLA